MNNWWMYDKKGYIDPLSTGGFQTDAREWDKTKKPRGVSLGAYVIGLSLFAAVARFVLEVLVSFLSRLISSVL